MLCVLPLIFATIQAAPASVSDLDNTLKQDFNEIASSDVELEIGRPGNFSSSIILPDFVSDGIISDIPFLIQEPIPKLDLPEITPQLLSDVIDNKELLQNMTTSYNISKLIEKIEQFIDNQTKSAKQEVDDEIDEDRSIIEYTTTTTTEKPIIANQDDLESEESGESEEEPRDLVQSLIKSFLGQLSTPEGGVDIDAIVGLIGGLSVPQDDGTYDFTGLTETLQSFLAGDDEGGGGGSDVGAFLGGLIGSIVQGSAKMPGGKGVGVLAGNLVSQILPGLSAPAPPPEGSNEPPQQGLDIGGFLQGFVKTFLSGSSGGGNAGGNRQQNGGNPFSGIKQMLFKSLFSGVSSLFVKPSGGGSTGGWR